LCFLCVGGRGGVGFFFFVGGGGGGGGPPPPTHPFAPPIRRVVVADDEGTTLFNALHVLGCGEVGGGRVTQGRVERKCELEYDVKVWRRGGGAGRTGSEGVWRNFLKPIPMYDGNAGEDGDRVRQSRVNGGKLGACEGVNTPTRQVLTLLSLVSVSRSSSSSSSSSSSLESQPQPDPEHKFISRTLEKKLLLQLSSPLLVVSGSLPPWSLLLPTLTPCIFSHGTRLTLLARSAFGVSRSVFGQQVSEEGGCMQLYMSVQS